MDPNNAFLPKIPNYDRSYTNYFHFKMDERIVNWIILIEISEFGRKLSCYFEIEKMNP